MRFRDIEELQVPLSDFELGAKTRWYARDLGIELIADLFQRFFDHETELVDMSSGVPPDVEYELEGVLVDAGLAARTDDGPVEGVSDEENARYSATSEDGQYVWEEVMSREASGQLHVWTVSEPDTLDLQELGGHPAWRDVKDLWVENWKRYPDEEFGRWFELLSSNPPEELESLRFGGFDRIAEDAAIGSIEALTSANPALEWLWLSGNMVDADRFVCPNLETLTVESVESPSVGWDTVLKNSECPDLRKVEITVHYEADATTADLIALFDWNVREVELMNFELTLKFLQAAARSEPKLERLDLYNCTPSDEVYELDEAFIDALAHDSELWGDTVLILHDDLSFYAEELQAAIPNCRFVR